jgi:hypothetical protein
MTDEELRALEQARASNRARRKEVNRARYFRRMRRLDPAFGRGRHADPLLRFTLEGAVTVSPRGMIVDRLA